MEARDERRLLRLQKQMVACKLLIIDELGFVPLSKTGAELLFELISQRYERGATLITSNLPFDEWTETFGTERLTGALLDRLTHHVNILEMNGDSYRLSQSRARRNSADKLNCGTPSPGPGRQRAPGVRSGGKRGRGAAGKTPFVAAVSTSPEGRPRKLKLAPVKGFRKREIARGAKHWLAPGAAVVTDGLGCWSALDEAACSHQAIRTGSGRQAARMASFKWVNTTLGNIKCAITGTYRKLGPDHAGRYLASFAWRYNRRYQLETMIPRFVHSAARTEPMPYRLLIAG